MNSKNIKKGLNRKIQDWIDNIEDDEIKKIVRDNVIITGGAIVSMLTGEEVNDYDVYFRTRDAVLSVAKYYVDIFNKSSGSNIEVKEEQDQDSNIIENGKIEVFIRSKGIALEGSDEDQKPFEDQTVTELEEVNEETEVNGEVEEEPEEEPEDKQKYRPIFFSSNAITLSNKIQLVIRFWGEVEEIHKNYDFAHCTCAYSNWNRELFLPQKALECIINKELYYMGSKYPLCSIIRSRKFIKRGWSINAGQYLKMCLQLNQLNLHDVRVLKDQLTGVDSAYFDIVIRTIEKKKESDPDWKMDDGYLFEVINRIF